LPQQNALPQILALARSGATSQAWAAFVAAGFDEAVDDFAALTLKGRLLKDKARHTSGAQRKAYFVEAGHAYSAAAALRPEDSYPLINAATLALFVGDTAQTQMLANRVLALIEPGIDPCETPYWREATLAEAYLLLGDTTSAMAAMVRAIQTAPKAWEDRAVTLRQLRLILQTRQAETGWLATFATSPCLHYSGIIGIDPNDRVAAAAIMDAVSNIAPAFGFGALAAGADILIAEALIARDAAINVVLPCATAEFRAASVSPFGAEWEPRFDALIEAAESVYVVEETARLSDAAIALASEVAMGAALDIAARNESIALSLRVPSSNKAPVADLWIEAGRPIVLLPVEGDGPAHGPPLPQAQRVCYLAFDGAIEMPLLPSCLQSWQEQDVMIQAFADIDAGLSAASMLTGDRIGDIKAAIDLRITDMSMDDAGHRKRVARMATAATPGSVIMGKSAAMLAAFDSGSATCEPMGEMASSEGAFEIFAFRPALTS
jgi:hypothetical protein